MLIRVDTTATQRGQTFDIIVNTSTPPTISLYYFNANTKELTTAQTTQSKQGELYINTAKAPFFDGFILATVNGESVVVKKTGNPEPYFVIGYKKGYKMPYKEYDFSGNLLSSGDLTHITEGFFYIKTAYNRVINALNHNFIIKDNSFKLNYNVTIPDTTIQDATVPNVTLPNITLSSVTLPSVTLPSVTLPDTTIGTATITKG